MNIQGHENWGTRNFTSTDASDRRERASTQDTSFDGGGGGGYDHPMEERVKELEKFAGEVRTELRSIDVRLTKIDTRMDTFATKEDMAKLGVAMHAEINAQTWKLVTFVCGFGTALVGATYFIATHVGK